MRRHSRSFSLRRTAFAWCGLFLFAAVALVAARPAQAEDHGLFGAKTFMLKNGMQVVVIENHRVPVVSHMVWYKVGAADEPAGKSGIAHLFEHLMFKGTKDIAPGDFSKIVARNGGQDNAFTGSDMTAYFQNIAVEHLPLVMKMEADRMRNLRLDDKNVLTERDVVVEERLSRIENEPAAILGERMDLALWVNHPYRNPVIGWQEELAALTRADAVAFYEKWYAPNNAILVVSGDVTVDQVRTLAETYYEPLPRGPEIVRSRPRDLPPAMSARIVMKHAQVAQPMWRRSYLAPSHSTAETPEQVYALQVLSELLGGGPTSRLYRALVIDHKLAVAAGSWYDPSAVDWSTFGVYLSPRPGVDIAAAESAMLAEIQKLLDDGIPEAEVDIAKLRMRAGVIYARDSLQGASRTIGQALVTGSTVADVEAWPERIGAVTHDQVVAAAKAVLDSDRWVTGILLPAPPAAADAAPVAPDAKKS